MQKKIFLVFFVILLVGILLTSFLSLSLIRSSYMDQLEEKLISNAVLIQEFIKEDHHALSSKVFQEKMQDLGEKIGIRITIIDEAGNVLVETFKKEGIIENHRNRPEIQAAYRGEVGKAIRYSNTVDLDMLYIALPLDTDLGSIVVRLAVNLLEIKKINQTLFYYIVISIGSGLIIATLIGYRFIDKIMEPIKEITEVSKKMAAGRLGMRACVPSKDEIGELADHFNHMADRLEDTIAELSDSNTKFKALLTSITNPIIAVDHKKNIILLNTAAEQLFGIERKDAIGKHILEVIRNNQLDEEIKRVLKENIDTQIEINVKNPQEKILKVYTNPIKLENDPTKTIGLVTVIEDVTEIRKLEKMRSNFVTNVSHELKTPLTSISGFVETLKSNTIEDEKTKKRFLDIIDIETERLTRLIEDILTLSEIESSQHRVLQEEIFPTNVMKEVEEMMHPIAANKGIALSSKIDMNLPNIYGNKDWFKQMLINLADNAIKYTPHGGKVLLTGYKKHHNIVITVKDTGIGIPKKDLPRLFERFYRVDKARSRKVGGTGLGLAIVKHIVLSFKGRVKVNSEEGKGTEFTVILPIKK
ncbi:two-component system histidine kinase PnpS [Clostridium formicaceticum]|uniref:histidine kinase n=1 Tax=Clostridium formicaceticum TaxID=1497 RepID=A0AAC9RN03_9CLOT|nr:ATP-binding protein [Clostridium formicaceticum]AOY77414.1 PAS domain-containing sensor histidine kinase [Clostridium formicaceticum]ARE87968.1 Alkaline phosphatase synthesis sensor protein PhoR [Clostridium formicaceticum]